MPGELLPRSVIERTPVGLPDWRTRRRDDDCFPHAYSLLSVGLTVAGPGIRAWSVLRPPGNVDHLARDESRARAGQERCETGHVLWLPDPVDRDLRGRTLLESVEVDAHARGGRRRHFRLDKAGSDRVRRDTELA